LQITGASRLAAVMGQTEIGVNSLHHQAINSLSSQFRIVAQAPDGMIESIEHRNRSTGETLDPEIAETLISHPES